MKPLLTWLLIAVWTPLICVAQESTPELPILIQDIRCEGNSSTSCQFIASHFYLSPGDRLDEEEVQNAKLRLSSLPNFKSVDIHLEKGGEKGNANVVIEVVEASAITQEFAVGTSLRNSSLSQKLAGRVSHQNLFGKGKILDLEAGGKIPLLQKPKQKEFSSRIQYVDPSLLGSKKYFLITGISYQNSFYTGRRDYTYESEQFGADVSLGRRLWDFSYITAGYQYRPTSKNVMQYRLDDGTLETRRDEFTQNYVLSYGWNSEDDPYFPTRGSRFNTSIAWSTGHSTIGYNLRAASAFRNTWTGSNGSIWTLKVGGTPGTEYRPSLDEDLNMSVAFARPIASSDRLGGIERGRWYVEPGFNRLLAYSSYNGWVVEPGIKGGVRLETKALGIVDFYALATTELGRGRR